MGGQIGNGWLRFLSVIAMVFGIYFGYSKNIPMMISSFYFSLNFLIQTKQDK